MNKTKPLGNFLLFFNLNMGQIEMPLFDENTKICARFFLLYYDMKFRLIKCIGHTIQFTTVIIYKLTTTFIRGTH